MQRDVVRGPQRVGRGHQYVVRRARARSAIAPREAAHDVELVVGPRVEEGPAIDGHDVEVALGRLEKPREEARPIDAFADGKQPIDLRSVDDGNA